MNKRKLMYSLLFLSVFVTAFGIYASFQKTITRADASRALVVQRESVAIYEKALHSKGTKVKGYLVKGNAYINYVSFNTDWWRIPIGNSFGYVSKKEAKIEEIGASRPEQVSSNFHGDAILTEEKTPIYSSISTSSKKIGQFDAHIQIEVINQNENWSKVNLGGLVGYVQKEDLQIDNGIPVLMYHNLFREEENHKFKDTFVTITPEFFESQMKWLRDNGYHTISLEDLQKYVEKKKALPDKSFVITFDDGFVSTRQYAYPILKKYSFKAENFIITSRTPDQSQPFDPDQLTTQALSMQDMEKMKDVFSFGAHTHALHDRKDAHTSGLLTQLPYDEVVADLKLNRKELPTPSSYFAYPYGNLNETGIRAVRDAGFKLAFTTQEGRVFPGDNPLILDRKGVYPNMDMEDFKNIFATSN